MSEYSRETWDVVGPWLNGFAVEHGAPHLGEVQAVLDAVEALHSGVGRRVMAGRK